MKLSEYDAARHPAPFATNKRQPCFLCSRQLMRAMRGPHRGLYVGVRVVLDGYERVVHKGCLEQELIEMKWSRGASAT